MMTTIPALPISVAVAAVAVVTKGVSSRLTVAVISELVKVTTIAATIGTMATTGVGVRG
jgi:hypothetical protein